MNLADVKNILFIRTDRIGDVVLSLPMLPVLKKNFPNASITVLVRPYTKGLVERHPCVDNVMLWNQHNHESLWKNIARLKTKKFDLAILPYPRFNLALMIFLAGIPIRVGTGYRWYSFFLNKKIYEHRKDAKKHEVEYNLNLLSAIGIADHSVPVFDFAVPGDRQNIVDTQLAKDKLLNVPFVVLHVGSGGSARDWPLKKFAKLGDELLSNHHLKVVLTGSESEKALVSEVEHAMNLKPVNYVGKFSLEELGAVFKRATVFISNSTGPLHIASMVGTSVIAFYPPIIQCSPVRWGPFTKRKVVFTADNKTCELCKGGKCQSNVCMDQIKVEDVVEAVKKLRRNL